MMKFLIVATIFAFAKAGPIVNNSDCAIIRNVNYDKEILKSHLDSPFQLAIDHDTNTLFFSFTANLDLTFKSAYISLKTNEFRVVPDIKGGFANAVNSGSGIVYMGGEDGVYQFNYDTKKATNLHIKDNANIWQMFYKDGLYFTTFPTDKAYLYENDQVIEIPELKNIRVMLVAVDNDKNIVYTNTTGVFMYVKDNRETIFLNDAVANGISSDIDGNLYFSALSGLYYINDKTKKVETLAEINNVYGIAVESNGNIIYGTEESIIRLKPSKSVYCNKNETNNTKNTQQ